MTSAASSPDRPLWLVLAPAIFLILWSGGFSIAKLGIRHAEPLTFLALRYAMVLVILAPFTIALKPAWPRTLAHWFHIAMVGFLIQAVYFGLCYLAFHARASSGTVVIGTHHHPIVSNMIQYAVGLAAILPLALAAECLPVDWTAPEFLVALAYLVIGNSLISMTLLLAMIRAGEVARVSSLFYLVPPVAALMAWPILGETMSPFAWFGMAVAAAGVAIASRRTA